MICSQLEVLNFSLKRNSLVCLPTGSGKTLVSIAVIHAMLRLNPSKIAVFCVKTNPLVEQQAKAIEDEVAELRVRKLSGQMSFEVIKQTKKVREVLVGCSFKTGWSPATFGVNLASLTITLYVNKC